MALISAQGVELLIWMAVFTVLNAIVMVCRFWAAKIKGRLLRLDDYFILVAYASLLSLQGCTWWAINNGLGAHTTELNPYQLGVQFKILVGTGIAWLFATGFCKLSILWMYTCIFTTRKFKIAAWVLMGVVSAYSISFLAVFLTNCVPVSYSWNPVPGGYCKSVNLEEIVSLSINMIIDTSVVILPMVPLWSLQLPTRKKIAISSFFCLGLLVVGVMGWRIQIANQNEPDFVYSLGNIGLVTHLEIWIGLIVACLPTLTPLVSKYYRKIPGMSKKTPSRKLKEANHTIGSAEPRSWRSKKNFSRLDTENPLELEEGTYLKNEAVVRSSSASPDEDDDWRRGPQGINVRHDVQIFSSPHQR